MPSAVAAGVAAFTTAKAPVSEGRHVRIPALGVDAVLAMARVRGGVLTPPTDPARAGWWRGGARPGAATGVAVIAAHTVRGTGGAFGQLHTLTPGDVVAVAGTPRARHATTGSAYVVTDVATYSARALARHARTLFTGPGPRLVLVTCSGWDGHRYHSTTVVTATTQR